MEQAGGLTGNVARGFRRVCGVVFRVTWLVLTAISVTIVPASTGQESKPSEYQVEATYLYNFSRFVEWPESPKNSQNNRFFICVLGDNPFGSLLNEIVANESIEGKSVATKQVLTPEDAADCRVVFISLSEQNRLRQILTSLSNSSALTVSDLPQFTDRGGMIQFVLEDNHVRFQVNVGTAKRAGLVMSSELLKVAVGVRKDSILGN